MFTTTKHEVRAVFGAGAASRRASLRLAWEDSWRTIAVGGIRGSMIQDSDGELYEKYADELIRFASGMVGPSDAADVLSSAVIRTFTSPAWAQVVNHRAYLYRAVLNEARMWRRSQGRRLARDDRHARPGDAAGGSTAHDDARTSIRSEVRTALAELDVRSRGVLFLSYWADLSPDEIGPLLDISASTVRRDLVRAHRKLRRMLDDRP